ncbi:class II aldolase/adducin N-terminal [Melampsora americana]|nr:class II aldolase/adducin N-terminal [Melampsora americana]
MSHSITESEKITKTQVITGEGQNNVQPNAKPMKFVLPPTFDDKEEERKSKLGKLAAAFRIFGKYGFDEGVAGHLTLRDPILKDHFWVNPFGIAFTQMTVSDLLLISPSGDIVAGGKPDRQLYNQLSSTSRSFHAIHSARPDVEAACHSHSTYGRAFSTLGIKLDITTQDACAFHNDLGLYTGFGGVALADEEGQRIAEALGDKKAVILQNHGLLTTGPTIEAAVWWFISLESLCRIQLLADAAAAGRGIRPIIVGDEEAKFTYQTTGSGFAGWAQAQPYFDKIHEETNGAYKL